MVLNTAFQQIAGASALLAGVVLLTAGIPKALAPARFAGQITAYGITPASVSPILARTVSAAELLAGLLLIAGLAAPSPVRLARHRPGRSAFRGLPGRAGQRASSRASHRLRVLWRQ